MKIYRTAMQEETSINDGRTIELHTVLDDEGNEPPADAELADIRDLAELAQRVNAEAAGLVHEALTEVAAGLTAELRVAREELLAWSARERAATEGVDMGQALVVRMLLADLGKLVNRVLPPASEELTAAAERWQEGE